MAAKGNNGLVHLLGVEHLDPNQHVEVLCPQARDRQEQVGLQLGDHILKCNLAKVSQVLECQQAPTIIPIDDAPRCVSE